jgi:hypothetical protein
MKLNDKTIWCVRDPDRDSEMCDVCWPTTIDRLTYYVLGTRGGSWEDENTTVYDNQDEAERDAEERIVERGGPPDDEPCCDMPWRLIRATGNGSLDELLGSYSSEADAVAARDMLREHGRGRVRRSALGIYRDDED